MSKTTDSSKGFLSLNIKDDKRTIKKSPNKDQIRRKVRRRNKEALASTRGLIYIGHIPHGFYEEEMKEYFTQFGRVTNIKVCRSRLSGKSKGYGFVEFSTPEVAKVVSETMNNYLMFKKRVVVMYIPYEKRPPFLFHSFIPKKVLPGKMRQERHVLSKNKLMDDKTFMKKKNLTLRRLSSKMERLNKIGIKCEIEPVE